MSSTGPTPMTSSSNTTGTASGSTPNPSVGSSQVLPILYNFDINVLQLRHAHRDLYEQIERLTAELQLLLSTTPPTDGQVISGAVNRLTVLRKRLSKLEVTMKAAKDRLGRIEGILGA